MHTTKKINSLSKRMSHSKKQQEYYLGVLKKKVLSPKTIGIALSALAGLVVLKKIGGKKSKKIILESTSSEKIKKPKKGLKTALVESAAILGSVAVTNLIKSVFKR